jgi:hypothetical protein
VSESDVVYPVVFYPRRPAGLIFHTAALGLLLAGGGYALWQAVNALSGATFTIYLVPAGIAILAAGQLIFSLYGLLSARYILDRDGVRLRWGPRVEDIPGDNILWVASEGEVPFRLRFPFFRWPGAVVGARKISDGRRLEFLSDRTRNLALVATQNVIYVVSPEKLQDFLITFGSIAEQGVIAPLAARSEDSTDLLVGFWADLTARFLVTAGTLLTIVLVAATALLAAGRDTVVLHAGLIRMEPVVLPAVRLMLLPVLNSLFAAFDLVLGMFFYRSTHLRPLAYLMWVTAMSSGLLFTTAVVYTLFFA